MCRLTLLAAVAAALALVIPASAQTSAGPGEPPGAAEKGKERPALDETGVALAAKTDALATQAQALVEEYRKALEARVVKLATENPTLKRLYSAGVFSMDGLLAGVPNDPLSALPWMRKIYEDLDKTAKSYVYQFGGVAKQKTEAAAVDYMRKVVRAQEIYREDDKDGNGILDYAPSFFELGQTGLLHVPPMKKGDQAIVVEGYKFRIVRADVLLWAADAAPTQGSGDVWLYVDQTGVIRAAEGRPAGPDSPPFKPEAGTK